MAQNKSLWDQIWSGLMSKFGKNFQLQVPFSSYYWSDPSPGYISYRTYDLFNERPLWTAVGRREAGGTGLYEAYGTVIQNAPNFVPTPSQQQDLADIQSDVNRALTNLQEDNSAVITGYALAKKRAHAEGKELEYSVWFEKSEWAKILQKDNEKLNTLQQKKADLLAKQYPDNKKYIDAYTPPAPSATTTDKGFLKCSINGKECWRAIYTAPTPNSIIVKMASGGPKLTILLKSTDPSYGTVKSWAHSQTDDPFFSTYTNGAWTQLDLAGPGEEVLLKITLEKIDTYPIGMGDWYSSKYLAKLKEKDSWAQDYSYEKVFGKDGLLPLISTDFIAFMGMSITISVSAAVFEKYRKQFTESAGVQIGPFSFGGDSGIKPDMFKRSAENSTFSVTMNSSYPFIVGYLVARADGETL